MFTKNSVEPHGKMVSLLKALLIYKVNWEKERGPEMRVPSRKNKGKSLRVEVLFRFRVFYFRGFVV